MKLNGFKISILIILVLVGFSRCNIFEGGSTSNTVLIINSITDENGDVPIFSNVAVLVNTLAEANLSAQTIDPNLGTDETTFYYSVIVDQIDVEYSRSSGLDQEGRDIPFGFSQLVHLRVDLEEQAALPFTIIQQVAKVEPPLVDLVDFGEEQVLKMEARVTFHATDLGGHRLEPVTASVSVWCANFGTDVE